MKRTQSMPTSKLLALMTRIPFFEDMTVDERAVIAEQAQIIVAEAGEVVIERGATDRCCYILLSGRAEVRVDRDGAKVAVVSPGQMVGEIGFILNSERTSWVLAEHVSVFLRVDRMLYDKVPQAVREKIKDQVILKLAKTIELQNAEKQMSG